MTLNEALFVNNDGNNPSTGSRILPDMPKKDSLFDKIW